MNTAWKGSEFALAQLKKFGWEEGKGLGAHESGNPEPLKHKLKFSKSGVGQEHTEFHWWDHVFNKACKNISVEEQNGKVQITRKEELQVSKKLNPDLKKTLYQGFVKKGTLHNEEMEEESDDSDEEHDLSTKLTDEELFKFCEGRTAHKGARHGINMSAKLARIQEQEQKLLQQWTMPEEKLAPNKEDVKKKKKKKKEKELDSSSRKEQMEEPENVAEVTETKPVEMKRKKRKRKEKSEEATDLLSNGDDAANGQEDQESEVLEKKKKKKKRNKVLVEENSKGTEAECLERDCKSRNDEEIVKSQDEGFPKKKKRKKDKLIEDCYKEVNNELVEPQSKKKKKKKRKHVEQELEIENNDVKDLGLPKQKKKKKKKAKQPGHD